MNDDQVLEEAGAVESSPSETGKGAAQPGQGQTGMEPLRVSSGSVLIIDQFMLANDQFLSKLRNTDQSAIQGEALGILAEQYGGCVVRVTPGLYRVYRDPHENIIALCPVPPEEAESQDEAAAPDFDFAPIVNAKGSSAPLYHVFVDTRCLVFLDAELLFDSALLDEYRGLRKAGKDKEGRDLLRTRGAAVRYGFNRHGDELGVFSFAEEGLIALWPDIA